MHPIRWCGHEWFHQCAISPLSLKATKDARDERMTQVQEATLPIIIQGKDDLAEAKTGIGYETKIRIIDSNTVWSIQWIHLKTLLTHFGMIRTSFKYMSPVLWRPLLTCPSINGFWINICAISLFYGVQC